MKLGFFPTNFRKTLKYEISWKSVQWESFSMRADRRTEMTKVIDAFRNSANAPIEKHKWYTCPQSLFSVKQQPPVGQGLLIIEASGKHSRHTTLSRTPLDKWSARRKDLYLTKHNTHNTEIVIFQAGFEDAILASERPQTHTQDRAASGTCGVLLMTTKIKTVRAHPHYSSDVHKFNK